MSETISLEEKAKKSSVYTRQNIINVITIFFSFVALILSVITCSDTHQSVKISERQGKAFIQVIDAKLCEKGLSSSFISIEITIKNFGQVAATNISAEFGYNNGMIGLNQKENHERSKKINDIGQGFERKIILKSNSINRREWKISEGRLYETVYFFGTIFYTDNLSGKNKKVDWCFDLPLNTKESLNQLTLKESEKGTFISSYNIEDQ
ncbi:MAG: hypothetical protein NTZ33_02345 [Bacteroidetes bacterium]|nr:hypothetical protein [Bacteroidota bacterium]